MQAAPLFHDIAEAAPDGAAYWLTCDDGVRIRIGVWPTGAKVTGSKGTESKGTVLLLPGRTEYVEKYGRASQDLAKRGYACVVVDWRGQGLADRLTDDRATGHVDSFKDYQKDMQAMVRAADELNLPKPFHLLAHSMGGCIGLRALHEGLSVASVAFTGPMWGISMPWFQRAPACLLARLSTWFGFGHLRAPGTGPTTYVEKAPFEDNQLTNDADMFAYMQAQTMAHPDLALGGPSLGWLDAALHECRALMDMTPPAYPCLGFLGTHERIVQMSPIHSHMDTWQGSRLVVFPEAQHETMMEIPAIRDQVFDETAALFDQIGARTP